MPRPKGNRDSRVNIRCNNKHKKILENILYIKRDELERYDEAEKLFENTIDTTKNSLTEGMSMDEILKKLWSE